MAKKKKIVMEHQELRLALEADIFSVATGFDALHFIVNNNDDPSREDQICWLIDKLRADVRRLLTSLQK